MTNDVKDGTGRLVIDPVTRIEGHMRIVLEVENGRVKDARTAATLFRGIETILKGRDPRDAPLFTQRVCGVCSNVHMLASVLAIENAVGAEVPPAAGLVRKLLIAAHLLQDHIIHFYHLHGLDWIDATAVLRADAAKAAKAANDGLHRNVDEKQLRDTQHKVRRVVDSGRLGIFQNAFFLGGNPAYRLSPEWNLVLMSNYFRALEVQRQLGRAMAVYGAKNPHAQTMVVGGVTCHDGLKPERIREYEEIFHAARRFIEEAYLPDVVVLAKNFPDETQVGSSDNFLAFQDAYRPGVGDDRVFQSGVIFGRNFSKVGKLDLGLIAEHVKHSWFEETGPLHPFEGRQQPKFTSIDDADKYSWAKAPRYKGEAMEVGPLARSLVSYATGDGATRDALDRFLKQAGMTLATFNSTLGRTAARAVETKIVADRVQSWIEALRSLVAAGETRLINDWTMPNEAMGVGYTAVPRGALSHWIRIKDKKIENYQMVAPSTWNFGPRDGKGKLGTAEASLIGVPVPDPDRPVEVLRTLHSLDPCMACAVHLIDPDSNRIIDIKVC
jgi:Ni,Fe-hydrogenase I large subunit